MQCEEYVRDTAVNAPPLGSQSADLRQIKVRMLSIQGQLHCVIVCFIWRTIYRAREIFPCDVDRPNWNGNNFGLEKGGILR